MRVKNFRFLFILISVLFLIFAFSCTSGETIEPKSFVLTVLHTNDTHGHPVKFFDYPAPDEGGMPARATLVNKIRKEVGEKNVLVLDAGDVLTGRPESNFFGAEPDFKGMDYIKYDAMCIGNHEFDKGIEHLKKLKELIKFPFLNANIFKKDGKTLFEPYKIFEMNGFKVAVFGLITEETPFVTTPAYVKDLTFKNPIEVAKELVPQLKKKAHFVIALTHMGFYEGFDMPYVGDDILAREVDGIDVIIGGHSHTAFEKPIKINNTYITSARHWGLYLGRIDITVENGVIKEVSGGNIPINLKKAIKKDEDINPDHPDWVVTIGGSKYQYLTEPIAEDTELLNILNPYLEKVEEELNIIIGKTTAPFTDELNRKDDNPICNLVCDAMKSESGADIVFQNGGGVRTGLGEGDIKKRDIYAILPFDNSVQRIDLTGAEVMEVLNYAATIPNGKGGFLQVAGIKFTLNYKTQKVMNVTLSDGSPLDMEKVYKVATNSFMKAGGDGYVMLINKNKNFYETSLFQRDMVISYIEKIKTLDPQKYNDDRIKIEN